jgi:alpha-glucuronidase
MADNGMWGATYGSGNEGNWGTQGLNYYVLAKMLWDPHRDVDQIIDDYCRAAYGPGAKAMKEYYRRA